ncbi:ATP-dependent helicase [Desulfothermus sp.]
MIDLERDLNESQLEAVTTIYGPVLVIAGAGSGKTRTIVYRLAHLVDLGISPSSILLLTFTKKAAQEMLFRAGKLLGAKMEGVVGGTFHSFANFILRRFSKEIGYSSDFTIIDQSDSQDIIKQLKDSNKIGRKDKSFPKKSTIFSLISKMRNKEISLEEAIASASSHLLIYLEDIEKLYKLYNDFKKEHNLMDYDDLLFNLEELLLSREDILEFLRMRYQFVMVDEYQDTNLVQGRIISHLAGKNGNIMAVGDDAQSIYSFRGATVRNILDFTNVFQDSKVILLEKNYRSVQSVLDFSNAILKNATEKYDKKLVAVRERGIRPQIIKTISDQSQAVLVVNKILELSHKYPLNEIAVLFRAGYQSYPVEVQLNKNGIKYKKFGGMKFSEAAHIKDVVAYLRLMLNSADFLSWQRVFCLIPKIGPRTVKKLFDSYFSDKSYLVSVCKTNEDVAKIISLMNDSMVKTLKPREILEKVLEIYDPFFKAEYHDDYPRRQAGLDELMQLSSTYTDLEAFLSDITLEPVEPYALEDPLEQYVTLSTIHSAKGLEWDVVILIDMVEDRFPSKLSQFEPEGMEEERRLFYVATTRARDRLYIYSPKTLLSKTGDPYPTRVSTLIEELDKRVFDEFNENYTGTITRLSHKKSFVSKKNTSNVNNKGMWCTHKVFGRGKIIGIINPNKYKIYFSGFGVKVILKDYVEIE